MIFFASAKSDIALWAVILFGNLLRKFCLTVIFHSPYISNARSAYNCLRQYHARSAYNSPQANRIGVILRLEYHAIEAPPGRVIEHLEPCSKQGGVLSLALLLPASRIPAETSQSGRIWGGLQTTRESVSNSFNLLWVLTPNDHAPRRMVCFTYCLRRSRSPERTGHQSNQLRHRTHHRRR